MTTPAPDRPRSSALQLIGIALAAVGVAITLFVLVALGLPDTRGTAVDAAAGVLLWAVVVGIAVLPVALGAWLVERGAPGTWRSMRGALAARPTPRPVAAPSRSGRERLRAATRWLLTDQWGLCVLLPGVAVAAAWLHRAGPLVSVVALSAFALAHPALCAVRAWWWASTALGVAAFTVALAAVGAAPPVTALREGAMVFLLPFTLYPAAVVVSGLVRAWRWSRGRR